MSVLSYLQGRSSAAVLSVAEKTSIVTSVSTLGTRLASHFGSTIFSHFKFGSYTRDTILPRSMDAQSDIDYMVVFAEGGYKPQTYLDRLKRFVEDKYYSSEIYQSTPTIVLELNHIRFELVPALRGYYSGYQIPDGSGNWQNTDPNDFNKALSDKNAAEGFHLKPAIRLLKYWNASNVYVFDSYGLEKWTTQQWYSNCYNQRDYLFSFFDKLAVPTDTQWRRDKVERAKKIVGSVREYEARGMPVSAEIEVKKLIPA